MRKYKTKIFLTLAFVCLFAMALVTTALCADITIYFETATGITDSFSSVTVAAGESVTLPKGNTPDGYSYVWVSTDGKSYSGGSKVVFKEEVTLRAIYAYDIQTADDFYAFCNKFDDSAYASLEPNDINLLYHHERYINVRLVNNITLTKAISLTSSIGSKLNIILNGYTLTIDKNLDMAIGGECFSTNFYGAGVIKYEGTGAIVKTNSSSKNGAEETKLFIGASTYVNAPNASLAKDTSADVKANYPVVQIYGTVNCKNALTITNSTNRNAVVNIYERAFVTLNGPIAVGDGNNFTVAITGGTIVTTDSSKSFFNAATFKYKISGGSFSFKYGDEDVSTLKSNILSGYAVLSHITSDSVRYATVFPNTCGVKHKYTAIETNAASCMHAKETAFQCGTCKIVVYVSGGTPGSHTIDDSQTTNTPAKPTQKGEIIKRCNQCGCAQYTFLYYNPLEDTIQVILDAGNGATKTVNALVKDVFDVDNDYKIKGLKNFKDGNTDYTADKIVKIFVPAGIKGIEFASDYASLKTIVLCEGIDIDVISMSKLSSLELIEIEKVARAKFHANCAPKSLKTIKTTKEGAKVIFDENSFANITALTSIVFSKKSEYSFGSSSFKGTGLTKLEMKDGSYSFIGEGAFSESKLEYVYLGEGITSLEKKQFDSISTLKKVVLMSVTKIADGDFTNMASGSVVYHHATSLTLGSKTFAGSNGITLYTVAAVTSGFDYNSSNQTFGTQFTIMKNIKHAYSVTEKDSTCTETGYKVYAVKDCPCNKNESTTVEIYKNAYTNTQASETIAYVDQKYPLEEHIPSDTAVIKYLEGYTKEGSYVKVCKMCSNALTDGADTCAPLVVSIGFSICEDPGESGAMVVKYVFNTEVLKEYKDSIDGKLEYGVVFAARATGSLGENDTPLDELGATKDGVVKLSGSVSNGYASFQMKMSGITEAQYKINFIMAAYINESGNITYIQDREAVSNPSGVTYKELKEIFVC